MKLEANSSGKRARRKDLAILTLFSMTTLLVIGSLPYAFADHTHTSNKPSGVPDLSLTILHTNDLHSHAEPFSERGRNIGGFARIAHVIRGIRKEKPETLVIDAGDIFQGTPLFTRYRGEVEVELLNKLGYDLYTIGNHEFDEGGINLAEKLSKAKFSILSSNLDCSELPALAKVIKPYEIREIKGQKVAFIGAITPEIDSLSMRRDGAKLKRAETDSKDREEYWVKPVRDTVEEVKAKGVDKIILVTHCGLDNDRILAQHIDDIDAIVGGHSHTKMAEAQIVSRPKGDCIIVQTGSYGRFLGKLQLDFDSQGRLVVPKCQYRLISITDKIPQEKDVKDYLDKMAEPLRSLRDTILSRADGDFDNGWRFYKNDSALGDLIADAFLDAGKSEQVQIAMENRGGIRARIDRGPINLEKIEEILPFDNHLATADVTGKTLRKNLEHSVAGSLGGRFLDISGAKFAYDFSRPPGDRIIFILTKDKKGNWQKLTDDGVYRIGMTDYSFKGGEGYDFKDATEVRYSADKLNVPLKQFFIDHPVVKPHAPDRICCVDGSLTGYLSPGYRGSKDGFRGSNKRISLYTANSIGVDTYKNGAVLPLDDSAKVLIDEVSPREFAQSVQDLLKGKGKNTLKNYSCVVISGKRSSSEKTSYAASGPLSREELESASAQSAQ